MKLEFPYQIVSFLTKEPQVGEPVYTGENGWYPQLAIKRRFKLDGIDEATFLSEAKKLFSEGLPAAISTGELVKPQRMPVSVVDVSNQDVLKELHGKVLTHFATKIISRYPDREGENYYPHVTAEFKDTFVIPVDEIVNQDFPLTNVWLLKDVRDENSLAHVKII